MAVYKPKGSNKYWYSFTFKGKHVQKSTRQTNKREAERQEAAHKTKLVNAALGVKAPEVIPIPTFKDALERFLNWSKREHEKPATHRRHEVSSVALVKYFRDMPLDQITAAEVERFKADRREQFATVRGGPGGQRKPTRKPIKPATVNRELASLRAVFNHVLKDGVPLKNPVSKIAAKAYREDNEQTRVLSHGEQMKYLAVATPMLRDVAGLMLETGMRPEEIYRIKVENVHLERGYLFNPFGKTRAAKRRIGLTTTAASILARRLSECAGTYLFPHDADIDRPVPRVNNAHDRALKASGVAKFRLYDLRHTWATRAAEAGIDLVTLAALLGHSKINMVMRYVHPTQAHQMAAIRKLEQFVAQKREEAVTEPAVTVN